MIQKIQYSFKMETDLKKKNRFYKAFTFLYVFMLFCAIGSWIYTGAVQNNSIFKGRKSQQYHIISDTEYSEWEDAQAPAGIRKEYVFKLTGEETEANYLAFYLVHHYAQVDIDGKMLYSLMPQDDKKVTKTVGCNWVMIPLCPEDAGKEIKVTVTPVYESVANRNVEFLTGSGYSVFISRIKDDALDIVLSTLSIIAGVVFLSIALFCLIQKKSVSPLLYLGTFSICIGLWKILDIRSMPLLFPWNPLLESQISLSALSLSVVSFAAFIRKQFSEKKFPLMEIAYALSAITATLQILLQVTGLADLRETLWASHILIILTVIAVLRLIITEWRAGHTDRRIVITFICFLLCIAGVVIDLLMFYLHGSSYEILNTLIIFLIYIMIMGIMSVLDMNQKANIDFATGLFNKNRCKELLTDETIIQEPICLMMFDLNELKKINDTFGHETGDLLISNFARILKKNLPSSAFLGRYGGDEFIAVIKKCDKAKAEKIAAALSDSAGKYNGSDAHVKLSYSVGYALSTDYPQCTMALLMEEADFYMYKDKRHYYEKLIHDRSLKQ